MFKQNVNGAGRGGGESPNEVNQKEVSSVADIILNNALHVYFLSNESNTLVQLTEVECLYDFSFNSFGPNLRSLLNPFNFISCPPWPSLAS
jgi:hypothetical protein